MSKTKKWCKNGSERTIARSNGMELFVQNFVNPENYSVHEFSLFRKREGVSIAPITTEKNIVLVRQFKQGVNDFTIEFPAGIIDRQESRHWTAGRELLEETGYLAKKVVIIDAPSHFMPRKSPSAEYSAIALECSWASDQDLDDNEGNIDVFEVTQPEFWKMIQQGEITSAPTKLTALMAVLEGYLDFVSLPEQLCRA